MRDRKGQSYRENQTTIDMEKTPGRQPKISIIVLTWNSYEVTRDCLLSLRKIDYPAFEVVLVDNGSVDDSGKKLAHGLS